MAVWTVDSGWRLFIVWQPNTNWAFIADACVDVTAKILYSSMIWEQADVAPVMHQLEKQRLSEEKIKVLWRAATDLLMVSQKLPDGESAVTLTSPSITAFVGKEEGINWEEGRIHRLIDFAACSPDSSFSSSSMSSKVPCDVDCQSLEALISHAWHRTHFTCRLTLPPPSRPAVLSAAKLGASAEGSTRALQKKRRISREGTQSAWERRTSREVYEDDDGDGSSHLSRRIVEVGASMHDALNGSLVVVVRDVTDRIERQQAEKEAIYLAAARERDEEANRFTRHEVKTSVIGALKQVDSIRSYHEESSGASGALDCGRAFETMLDDLQSGLSQTLEVVLSQAMAREVVHGVYVARTVPIKIDEVLRLRRSDKTRDGKEAFPCRLSPSVLPIVDLDPRLLTYIHRNAVSNACKYGKPGGPVMTEVNLENHVLTLRVINEPGDGHERLCMLRTDRIFEKGARFHPQNLSVVSKGDGAWIMRKCSHCLQGRCSIKFEAERTVFELVCPAPERLDESYLEKVRLDKDVWAIGVDDCEFQRMILTNMFESVGVPSSRTRVLGESASEIEQLADILVELMRSLPPMARVLAIVDENLDLPEPSMVTLSGSYAIKAARERLLPSEESRLLAVVRSANDSPDEVKLFNDRAHAFLTKMPTEPDRVVIRREWYQRFGADRFLQAHETLEPTGAMDNHAGKGSGSWSDHNRSVALAELTKIQQLLDSASEEMQWNEMWRWIHRIKGIVATAHSADSVRAHDTTNDRAALAQRDSVAGELISRIEELRSLSEAPHDFTLLWWELKRILTSYMSLLEQSSHR